MRDTKLSIRQKHLAVRRLFFSTAFRAGLLLLLTVLSMLYVAQTSSVSTKGYDINSLQKQITELKQEGQRLDFQIAKYRSMESIQERVKHLNLVAAENVEYVTLPGTAVARR